MSAIQVSSAADLQQIGGLMAKSGYFEDTKDAAKACVKILAGQELGFGPFASISGIHVVKGKPAVSAALMAAAIKASAKYDYEVLKHDATVCRIAFYEKEFAADLRNLKRQLVKGEIDRKFYENAVEVLSLGISEFTKEEASAAGTQNMSKFPKNMLFARAVSNGFKWYCQDLSSAPVYTPEELGATVNAEGELVDVQVIEPTPEPVATVTVGTDDRLRKRYFAALSEAGINDIGRQTLKAICKVESSNDLTAAQVDAIISKLEPEKVAALNTGVNPKTGERLVLIPDELAASAA